MELSGAPHTLGPSLNAVVPSILGSDFKRWWKCLTSLSFLVVVFYYNDSCVVWKSFGNRKSTMIHFLRWNRMEFVKRSVYMLFSVTLGAGGGKHTVQMKAFTRPLCASRQLYKHLFYVGLHSFNFNKGVKLYLSHCSRHVNDKRQRSREKEPAQSN